MAYSVEIDYRPVFSMMEAFDGVAHCHLMRAGARANDSWAGSWDLILALPTSVLSVTQEGVFVDGVAVEGEGQNSDPFYALEHFLKERPSSEESFDLPEGLSPPPFVSGIFGHINYDLADYLEPSLALPKRLSSLPHLSFAAYEGVIAIHRDVKRAFVFAQTQRAATVLQEKLEFPISQKKTQPKKLNGDIFPSHTADAYKAQLRAVIDHILEGDIFQANITQQLVATLKDSDEFGLSSLEIFSLLNEKSQASFGALLQYSGGAILSNSPERYFSVKKNDRNLKVIMEPIKGTMPVYQDAVENEKSIQCLLKSDKDRAENIMIVDLVRNDLSKVCLDDTIQAEKLCELKSYASVHHLVSRVSGTLAQDKSAFDVLKASFPCGSITGAPKIKSMEIIAALEKAGRGIYCGAIGYIDDRGSADFSIPIRTTVLDKDMKGVSRLSYGSGGGITVLSNPDAEHQELVDKAAGALSAMGLVLSQDDTG